MLLYCVRLTILRFRTTQLNIKLYIHTTMFADAQSDKQSIDTAAIMTSVYISMDAALKLTAFLHKEML